MVSRLFWLLRAAGFAVIQRHGAVMIKFLTAWIWGGSLVSIIVVSITDAAIPGVAWNGIGVAGGFIIAAAVCFLTARRTA